MDPTVLLLNFLRSCEDMAHCVGVDSADLRTDIREDAAQALLDLSNWVASGGFLPDAHEAVAEFKRTCAEGGR